MKATICPGGISPALTRRAPTRTTRMSPAFSSRSVMGFASAMTCPARSSACRWAWSVSYTHLSSALVGTAIGSLLFLLRDKRVALFGFVGLAVVLVMFYFAAWMLDTDQRATMVQLITLYGVAPALIGNAVADVYKRQV